MLKKIIYVNDKFIKNIKNNCFIKKIRIFTKLSNLFKINRKSLENNGNCI